VSKQARRRGSDPSSPPAAAPPAPAPPPPASKQTPASSSAANQPRSKAPMATKSMPAVPPPAAGKAPGGKKRGRGGRPSVGGGGVWLRIEDRPPCIAFSGIEISARRRQQLESKVGVRVVDDWCPDVTHLVADAFRRTTKLMCAICVGAYIVVPNFLSACQRAGSLIDPGEWLLRDELCEAAFAKKRRLPEYSLAAAVARARSNGPLLADVSVCCSRTVTSTADLRSLVHAAGGIWLEEPPGADAQRGLPASGPGSFLHLGKDFDPELLREAACTQILRFEQYRL